MSVNEDVEVAEAVEEDEKEIVEIYLEDLETLAETIAEYERDEDIDIKIEKTLVDERVIYLQGEVGEDMANSIIPMIHYFNILDDNNDIEPELRKPIQIFVDSEGGEIYKGFGILSAMERSKTPIWTYLEGNIGMSMGFILYLGGHRRFMSRFGNLLYHELRGASDMKTLAESKNMIQHYDKLQNKIDNYIVERTKIPMKKLKNQRKKNMDWYIDFDEAKRYVMFDEEI